MHFPTIKLVSLDSKKVSETGQSNLNKRQSYSVSDISPKSAKSKQEKEKSENQ